MGTPLHPRLATGSSRVSGPVGAGGRGSCCRHVLHLPLYVLTQQNEKWSPIGPTCFLTQAAGAAGSPHGTCVPPAGRGLSAVGGACLLPRRMSGLPCPPFAHYVRVHVLPLCPQTVPPQDCEPQQGRGSMWLVACTHTASAPKWELGTHKGWTGPRRRGQGGQGWGDSGSQVPRSRVVRPCAKPPTPCSLTSHASRWQASRSPCSPEWLSLARDRAVIGQSQACCGFPVRVPRAPFQRQEESRDEQEASARPHVVTGARLHARHGTARASGISPPPFSRVL